MAAVRYIPNTFRSLSHLSTRPTTTALRPAVQRRSVSTYNTEVSGLNDEELEVRFFPSLRPVIRILTVWFGRSSVMQLLTLRREK